MRLKRRAIAGKKQPLPFASFVTRNIACCMCLIGEHALFIRHNFECEHVRLYDFGMQRHRLRKASCWRLT